MVFQVERDELVREILGRIQRPEKADELAIIADVMKALWKRNRELDDVTSQMIFTSRELDRGPASQDGVAAAADRGAVPAVAGRVGDSD